MELSPLSADHITSGTDARVDSDDELARHEPSEVEVLVNDCQDQDEVQDVVCGLEDHRGKDGLRTRRKVKMYKFLTIFVIFKNFVHLF